MKKFLPITLLASSLLFATNSKPIAPGLALAYMNNIVAVEGEKYLQLEGKDRGVKTNVDLLYSDTYFITNIMASYVYDNMVGFSAALPLMQNSITTESGVSDAMVEINFNAGDFGEKSFKNNIFALRYSIDSGDFDKGLGSGSSSISILWDSTIDAGNDFDLFWSLMWTFYLDDVTKGVNLYTPGEEDTGWIGLRHPCLLSDKIDTNLKLNWQTKYSDDIIAGPTYDSGYNLVDATVEWSSDKLIKNFPLKAGVKIPIWDSQRVDNELSVFVGAAATF